MNALPNTFRSGGATTNASNDCTAAISRLVPTGSGSSSSSNMLVLPVQPSPREQHNERPSLLKILSPKKIARFVNRGAAMHAFHNKVLDVSSSTTASSCSSVSSLCSDKSGTNGTAASHLKSCLKVATLEQSLLLAVLDDEDDLFHSNSSCGGDDDPANVEAVVAPTAAPAVEPLLKSSKHVTWSTHIEEQLYTTILGDNPSTVRGPPLSIGKPIGAPVRWLWTDFDEQRQHTQNPSMYHPSTIPAPVREHILKQAGYSRSDLQAVEAKLLHIKLARRANAKPNFWESLTAAALANQAKQAKQRQQHGKTVVAVLLHKPHAPSPSH